VAELVEYILFQEGACPVDEIFVSLCSVENWAEPRLWSVFFQRAQRVFGRLLRIDTRDPVRRRVSSLDNAAHYVSEFAPKEISRWIFGEFEEPGIELTITHYREPVARGNDLLVSLPLSFLEEKGAAKQVGELLTFGGETLGAFWGYCEKVSRLRAIKKKHGPVNLEVELPGIFWMNYLNAAYVNFFGKENVARTGCAGLGANGAATLILGPHPDAVSEEIRNSVAKELGEDAFVNGDGHKRKAPGEHVLTFEQIKAYGGSRRD
jgi:hypothetical protein